MGGSCSAQRQRAFGRQERQNNHGYGAFYQTEDGIPPPCHRSVRHSVISQVPDDSISALYPVDDTYVLDENNLRSPKRLIDLSIDSLCRALPFLEGELPAGLPQDIVDDIVKSLMQHSALNAATLRVLRNCEIGALNLAGCRGVSDAWLEPFSVKTPRSSPQLSNLSSPSDEETMECMDLGHFKKKSEEESENASCSTSSFVSASSTPISPTTDRLEPSNCVSSPSSLPVEDFVMHNPSIGPFLSQPNVTSSLFLLDLRGSQGLTDRGLTQLSNLGSLEVAKLDNCHSLAGRGLVAFASSHRLHTLSLANCRRLTDEAVINISHLLSIENLSLDGCRCLTDRSLVAISNLYDLRKLDLSQCDLITDEGLEHLEELEVLEELSLGWCKMITNHGLNTLTRQPGRSLLRVLRLARCPVTDEGIAYVARLSSLTALDVNGCSNIGSAALGKTLAALPNLENLDVSYCPGILRTSWQDKIKSLKSLELCYSGIRDVHLSRFSHLPALEELNLDSSPVGDWAISHLTENCVTPNLKNLDLADTDLTDLGMAHLPKFTKLTRLSLFYCNITNAGLRHLSLMTHLEVLNLDSRDISDDGLAHLRSLTNLKSLDIFSGRITDAGCAHLSRVNSLETLELCGGGIGDLGCTLLAGLENLTSLNLSQNERITNRGAAALAALSKLRALNLSNTRVNSAALRFLSGLVHLQSLAVYGCHGIDNTEGLVRFQNGLPNLKCLKMNIPTDNDGIVHHLPGMNDDSDAEDDEFLRAEVDGDDDSNVHNHLHMGADMEDSDGESQQFEDASIYSDND